MQWRVRGSSTTRALRKQERERWFHTPVLRGKPIAPEAPAVPAVPVVPPAKP